MPIRASRRPRSRPSGISSNASRPARCHGASCCSGPAPATGNNGSSTPPAPTRLAELPVPLLLVQCLGDETLPSRTLDRNLENLRAAVARNRLAQLRELPAHDHFAMRPGEREPSPELVQTLVGWLRQIAR